MRTLVLAVAFLATTATAADLRVEPETQPAVAQAPRPKAHAQPRHVPEFRLEGSFLPPKAKAGPRAFGTPEQVGYARDVPGLREKAALARELLWEKRADGTQVAALRVTSPAAAALRLGVRVEALPAGAVLRFTGANGGEPFDITAQEVGESLTAAARTGEEPLYWSPVVESESVTLQLELPAGMDPAQVRLSIPALSHLVTNASENFATKAAAACNIDAMCHQGEWAGESNAVARIVFTKGASTFVCTGTLLADRDAATTVPYFLTANHCVPDQAIASTVQSYWFYRSTACNTGTRGSFQTRTGGGTLLHASAGTDTALLRLAATPPAGATYAGWSTGAAGYGAAVTGLHHPTGDLLKISFGAVRSFYNCTPLGNGQFTCNGASSGSSSFVGVNWTGGLTEGGSSGSGLFLDNGRYLVGQLYGGGGSCTEGATDIYGRFDVAYNAGLYQWLGGAPTGPILPPSPPAPSVPAIEPAINYSDLWWNAAESGWGLSLTQHGAALFGAWYAYDAAGKPLWVVMPGGKWTTPTTFTAELYTTTGPEPLVTFNPAQVVTTRVGSATLNFATAGQGTLTYTVNGAAGSKAITRQSFGSGSSVANYADLWWNAAESGWGLSISQQGSTLFAVWYSYGADGKPVWYVMPGGTWAGDTYGGTLYRTTSAPTAFFGAGTFNPAAVQATAVGSMSIRFWSPGGAVMSYTVNGVLGAKSIQRQSF